MVASAIQKAMRYTEARWSPKGRSVGPSVPDVEGVEVRCVIEVIEGEPLKEKWEL